jgi:hypothetical protein
MLFALLAILAILVFCVIYIGGVVIFEGWVLTKLWAWFLVPLLGLKPLTIAYAIGISLIVRLLTYHIPSYQELKDQKLEWSESISRLLVPFVGGLFALGLGYIVHLYL